MNGGEATNNRWRPMPLELRGLERRSLKIDLFYVIPQFVLAIAYSLSASLQLSMGWLIFLCTLMLVIPALASVFAPGNAASERLKEMLKNSKPETNSDSYCVDIELRYVNSTFGRDSGWLWMDDSHVLFQGVRSDIQIPMSEIKQFAAKGDKIAQGFHFVLSDGKTTLNFNTSHYPNGDAVELRASLNQVILDWLDRGDSKAEGTLMIPVDVQASYWLSPFQRKQMRRYVIFFTSAWLIVGAFAVFETLKTKPAELSQVANTWVIWLIAGAAITWSTVSSLGITAAALRKAGFHLSPEEFAS